MLGTVEAFQFRGHLIFYLLENLIFDRSSDAAADNVTASDLDIEFERAVYRASASSWFRGRRSRHRHDGFAALSNGAHLAPASKAKNGVGHLPRTLRKRKKLVWLRLLPVAIQRQPIFIRLDCPGMVRHGHKKVPQVLVEEARESLRIGPGQQVALVERGILVELHAIFLVGAPPRTGKKPVAA